MPLSQEWVLCFLSVPWGLESVSVTWTGHERHPFDSPQDAASFKAEPSCRGPVSEPEPVYSREAADHREARSQQGLAYAPEAVYDSAEAPGHYQGGANPAGSGQGRPVAS